VIESLTAFLGGLGGTILLLMPGYVLSRVYSRGVRGPELAEQVFIATTGMGGVVTHILMLWWTIPLALDLRKAVEGPNQARDLLGLYPWLLLWVLVVLFGFPAMLGGVAARAVDVRVGPLFRLVEWFGVSTTRRTAEAWTWV
jgi:hypothetical protein